MILGSAIPGTISTEAECIIVMGQSNADGMALYHRLAGEYAYHGVAAAYPAARVAQTKYVTAPTGCYIYNKRRSTDTWNADDGAWAAYDATANAHNKDATNYTKLFGPELSFATLLNLATGREVFIIKPAWSGTALLESITSGNLPGPWNNEARALAIDAYIAKATRDFKTYRPGVRLRTPHIIWWQGEKEVLEGTSAPAYIAAFDLFYAQMKKALGSYFVQAHDPVWSVVQPSFVRDGSENTINGALATIVSTHPNFYLVTCSAYPRNQDLSAAEDDPVTKGTPNAQGLNDDDHISHIGIVAVGEKCMDNVVTTGVL